MLTVYHVNPKTNFTMIQNEIIFNDEMSEVARIVLIKLIARPPGWQTTADRMYLEAAKARPENPPSRRSYREAFKELERFGYLARKRVRVGQAWHHHITVTSDPSTLNIDGESPRHQIGGHHTGEHPASERLILSTDLPSTESSSARAGSPLRAEHENSSALPDGSTANRRRDTNQQPSIPRPRRVQNRRPHPTPLADLQALYDQDRIDEDDLWAVLEEGFAGVAGVNESTVYGMLGSWHVAAIAKYLEAETGVRPVWEGSETLTVLLRHWGDGEPHRRGDLRAAHAMAA